MVVTKMYVQHLGFHGTSNSLEETWILNVLEK